MKVCVTKNKYAQIFGGVGFHNNDASIYHIIDAEQFNQTVCKSHREMSPGFMRTFAGYSDWSKEAMDEFAEYYEKMDKWTDTPMYLTAGMGKIHFSDEEIKKYAEDVAERLAYLYYEKDVKHIRYYCFSNELSRLMYGVLENDLPTFKKYHTELFRAFQNKGLPIGLLATDASEYSGWKTVDWAIQNMADISEDYCVHIYEREHDVFNEETYDFFYEKCSEIVGKAIKNFGKRVILGEMGVQKLTKPGDGQLSHNGGAVIDTCRYYDGGLEEAYCGLMLAEMGFAAINAGIFAIAFWSYIDHPDPYSCAYSTGDEYSRKWGERERFFSCTMDSKYNKWGVFEWDGKNNFMPRLHYWCLAPFIKFFKRNSKVLDVSIKDKLLRSCAIENRDGSVSIGIINRHKKAVKIDLECELFNKAVRVYEYDTQNVPYNKFADMQDFCKVLPKDKLTYELKPESVTFFTTDYKEKEKAVYAEIIGISDGVLSWNKVSDSEHCYYRVFASECPDFNISKENQIASTIATEIPIKDASLYYKVASVDRSGNI